MSSVIDTFRNLAPRLLTGGMSDEEFYLQFSTSATDVRDLVRRTLRDALDKRDPILVEFGTFVGHRFGFDIGHLDLLVELAAEPWHFQHENVVSGIVSLRAPASVGALYQAALARFDYLDFDDTYALGVKAVWGLAKIGTVEAVNQLGDLLVSGNPRIKECAAERLQSLSSDAEAAQVREAATRALVGDPG